MEINPRQAGIQYRHSSRMPSHIIKRNSPQTHERHSARSAKRPRLQVHDAGRSTICPAKGHAAFYLHQTLNVMYEKSARPQVKARAELTHDTLQP